MLNHTDCERHVENCINENKPADFTLQDAIDQFGTQPLLRAANLREIFFGLDLDKSRGRSGMRIKGACIQGALNLAGASGRGGTALPGLSLISCHVEEIIDVTDSRLFSLILQDTAIIGLEARGVIIDGELDISRVHPMEGSKTAFINVRSGRIAGNIYAQGAKLYGLSQDPKDESIKNDYRYALRLTETHIGGSVYLTEGVYVQGGVVIRNSTIGGNVWADRAEVEAADGYALSVQGSDIKGGVRLADGFKAMGCICLRQAVINGSVRFDGGIFKATEMPAQKAGDNGKSAVLGSDRAIDMERATVAGDVSFGVPGEGFERAQQKTEIHGDASLAGATINGDVSWSELHIHPMPSDHHRPGTKQRQLLLNFETTSIARRLRAHHMEVKDVANTIIRLRATRVGLLQDVWRGNKQSLLPWGPKRVLLQMDGFVYTLPSTRDVTHTTALDEARIYWKEAHTIRHLLMILAAYIQFIWESILIWTLRYYPGPARQRLTWLKRLYPRGCFGRLLINRETFRSQPYQQAADAFAAIGLDADARRVKLAQKRYVRKTGRIYRVPDRALFDITFGYGISPGRAVTTLFVAFLIGWFGAWRANIGGMLAVKVQPIEEIFSSQTSRSDMVATREVTSLPCGREINNALYALDIFIPIVDLRQDSECEIPAEPIPLETLIQSDAPGAEETVEFTLPGFLSVFGIPTSFQVERKLTPIDLGFISLALDKTDFWRICRALYALAGWVLISLAILTFSGILNRRV
ncbi:MAG: hypothetical protein AAFR90_06830 [Pseudomonadota bacterium]